MSHPLTTDHKQASPELEPLSQHIRTASDGVEPRSLRTYTPSRAVIASSSGCWHRTPDGRRLLDYTSGVLVANLGHNPTAWMQRFLDYMQWKTFTSTDKPYFSAIPLTTYNAITPLEVDASSRLVQLLQKTPYGAKLQQVLWAASGSEAIQKALWACMSFDRTRPMILATRYGFHGKKGLSNAITGSETDAERDPRVKFISFPMESYNDVAHRNKPFHPEPYWNELSALWHQFGRRLGTLITEPYLGGGGSYHPPKEYLQLLQRFCEEHEILFVLDEVQANFGRTGRMFALEKYEITPDVVVLGKGLGNGVPVAAAVGSAQVFQSLNYGEASDTWSANPLNAASVLATLDCFAERDILQEMKPVSQRIEEGLVELQQFPFVAHIRGEEGGMVWGVEFRDFDGRTAADWANQFVLQAYLGSAPEHVGVHLLGPLAKKVVRISPPLTITLAEAEQGRAILLQAARTMASL